MINCFRNSIAKSAIKPILAKQELVKKVSFSILDWKRYTYVSQIQNLITEKTFFASTSSIENFDFNFVKPLDSFTLLDISIP